MWLMKLAWKNLWRNRSRTVVTTSSIFFAVILSITTSSLQDGVFDLFVKNMVSFYTGYIQVHRTGYWDQQVLDNGFERSKAIENLIARDHHVYEISPRIESYALSSNEEITKGCLVVGIVPIDEDQITFLRSKVTDGSYFNDSLMQNTALVSEGLARSLALHVSDTVVLISQGYHGAMAAGKYRVKGILHFGSPLLNNQLLYLTLPVAQDFFRAENLLTSYVMDLTSTKYLEKAADALKNSLGNSYEVMTWKEMLPEVDQHIQTDKGSMRIIQGILYLLICFGIFGTLLMMMAERKYEMGMLISIGMKKSKLIAVVFLESAMSVLIGSVTGMLASIPIVYYLKEYPIRFKGELAESYSKFGFEPIFPAAINVQIFITQGVVVLLLGFVLSIYPIVKILNLDPVVAMKR